MFHLILLIFIVVYVTIRSGVFFTPTNKHQKRKLWYVYCTYYGSYYVHDFMNWDHIYVCANVHQKLKFFMGTMIATYISFAIVFYVFFLIGAVLFLIFLNKWEIVVFFSFRLP